MATREALRQAHEKTLGEHHIDLVDVIDALRCALDHVLESKIAEQEDWRAEAFVAAVREIKRLRDQFADALKDEEKIREAGAA
jgi:molecular chaperone GrpE (heat shock protein)